MCQKMHIQKLVCRWLEPEIPSETFLKSTWANHNIKKQDEDKWIEIEILK